MGQKGSSEQMQRESHLRKEEGAVNFSVGPVLDLCNFRLLMFCMLARCVSSPHYGANFLQGFEASAAK